MAKHERAVVLALCLAAAVRLFVFNAAFPFFNNVDEQAHFDLVYKYSNGQVPESLESYSPGASDLIVLYATPEYLCDPLSFPDGNFPPPTWNLPREQFSAALRVASVERQNKTNHESTQPPVYYGISGVWYRLGDMLGLQGGMLLYWLRFLNVILYVPLVYLSHRFAGRFYPDRLFVRIGAAAIMAVFPQDVFYSINNDIMSPLLFAGALWCLLDVYLSRSKSHGFHFVTGLLVAATFLVKFSNVAVLAALAAVLALRTLKTGADGRLRREAPKMVLMFFAAATPIMLWLTRNVLVFGDVTGSAAKIGRLGWTAKPLMQMWHHPIFTPGGLIFFWSDLMKTFWRGEFVWHTQRIASAGADSFYWISTTVFLMAAVVSLGLRKRADRDAGWAADIFGFGTFGLSVLVLAGISVAYDYGNCWYPSNQHPYFTSGRLIIGLIVPFVMLYVRGLEFLLSKSGLKNCLWPALCLIAAVMVGSEMAISTPVFGSLYNWFHMM